MPDKLKTEHEINSMDNKELLEYYKVLKLHRKEILQYAKDFIASVALTKTELKHRMEDLQYDEIAAEDIRKVCWEHYWYWVQATVN